MKCLVSDGVERELRSSDMEFSVAWRVATFPGIKRHCPASLSLLPADPPERLFSSKVYLFVPNLYLCSSFWEPKCKPHIYLLNFVSAGLLRQVGLQSSSSQL